MTSKGGKKMKRLILKELKEIKKLLRVIVSNQEQENQYLGKCVSCNGKAELKLDDENFICENCAQIQGELSEF